nr:MAG TPA: hypothetical protein [Caudoviricetes sp.]
MTSKLFTAETPARASAGSDRPALMMAGHVPPIEANHGR